MPYLHGILYSILFGSQSRTCVRRLRDGGDLLLSYHFSQMEAPAGFLLRVLMVSRPHKRESRITRQ